MAKIISNNRYINARLKQPDGATVAKDVWSDATIPKRAHSFGCTKDVFVKHISNAVPTQWPSTGIQENKVVITIAMSNPAQRRSGFRP